MASKVPEAGAFGAAEKKVKLLEQQRMELLEVNKQWDQHFRSMKQQYEQKVMEFPGAEPRTARGGGLRGL